MKMAIPLRVSVLVLGATVLLVSAAGAAGGGGEGRIVFASDLPRYPPPANLNLSRVYSVGVDGRGRLSLSGDPGALADEWASVSPDRTKIAFLRGAELWLMNANGSEQRKLLSPGSGESFMTEFGIREPAWSPDGTRLAVNVVVTPPCSENSGKYACDPFFSGVIVDLAGARVGTTGLNTSWSPDGRRLVYEVDESGGPDERVWQIVVSNVDGTSTRELTAGIRVPEGACWAYPSWSPDGRRIAVGLLDCNNGFDIDVWLRSYIFPVGQGQARVLARDSNPVWSPGGLQLAFLHGGGDTGALYVSRGDGSRARLVSSSRVGAPVWSSRGGRLAFTAARKGQIETVNADGTHRRRITREPEGSRLTPLEWSRDGKRILYTATVIPSDPDLWTMSPAGTNLVRVTNNRLDENDPAWSPDGHLIAFARWSAHDKYGHQREAIYTIRPDGTGERLLIGGPKALNTRPASNPAWSPDGTRIAFTRSSNGELDSGPTGLFVANADGSQARRLVKVGGAPVWSPDGSRIAYLGGSGVVTLLRLDGTGKATVPVSGYNCSDVAWSPDGQRFALSCADQGTNNVGIYVMRVDGSDFHRVVGDRSASSPTWSPDGTSIVFSGNSCLAPTVESPGICAVGADGSGLRTLTPFRAVSTSPNWSTTRAGLR